MPRVLNLAAFILFLIINLTTAGQSVDTANLSIPRAQSDSLALSKNPSEIVGDNGFSPLMGIFLIMFVVAIGIGIGAGISIAVFILLTIIGVISAGVISTSMINGYHQKSISKAFSTLVILSFTIVSLITGTLIPLIVIEIYEIPNVQFLIVVGSLIGLLVGYGLGLLALFFIKFTIIYFKQKFSIDY